MSVQVFYQQAEEYLRQEDWHLAAYWFEKVLELMPTHACANHLLGKARAQLGDLAAAESCQLRSCDLDPSLGWNWFALAELYEIRGAFQDAHTACSMAANSLPNLNWIRDYARRLRLLRDWERIKQLANQPRFQLRDLIQIVWELRPDLRDFCGNDQSELLLWLLLDVGSEYVASLVFRDELIEYFKPMQEQLAVLPGFDHERQFGEEPPISSLMHQIWFHLPHLQSRFDLATPSGRAGLFWWYVLDACVQYRLHSLLSIRQVNYIFEVPEPRNPRSLIRLVAAVRAKCGVEGTPEEIYGWFKSKAVNQYRLAGLVSRDPLDRFSEYKVLSTFSPDYAFSDENQRQRPFGVNLIGYASGQLGIGEDIRMAANALDAVSIPYSVYNIDPDTIIDCNDHSLTRRISQELPFRFNLFCTSAVETARLAISEYLPMMTKDYFNIGYWPWEFSRWPPQWEACYRMVDEVWASTAFTAGAYSRDAILPVELMPMVVDVTATAGATRADFGLPCSAHLFIFSFDACSTAQRKNPMAVVDSFQRAFPIGSSIDVSLVVKVMRGERMGNAYRRLKERASFDKRICIVEQTLSRDVLLDLYRACDTYVSLHRCEGFGRGIAEAMLLGKSVIATAYSGNLDFCTDQTSLLVPVSRFSTVLSGEYPQATGLHWADPDIACASEAMVRCAVLGWKPNASEVAKIAQRYSAYSVGSKYKDRLSRMYHDCSS